jgi:PAS domain S-box-containing protein
MTSIRSSEGNMPWKSGLAHLEGGHRALLEAAPDAMVVVDQSGFIVLVNAQAETQFGYSRDELLGQKVTAIIPEGFAERLIADDLRSAAEALAQQIGTGIELTARRKDGGEFPIELMLSPLESSEGILVTAAIRNISVRKAAELRMAQMESRYRGLLEAAPDAMVVVNHLGLIVLVNAQAETQFGYSRDELLGQKVTAIIPEGFAERLIADDLRSAAEALAQQIGTGIELTARRKDGGDFPIELMLSPLESADGILVTAAIRNISVRKAAERHLDGKVAELHRSNEELALAEGVRQATAAKSRFLSTMSHEIRTPLNGVIGNLELLALTTLDRKQSELIDDADKAAKILLTLVGNILDFSKIEAGQLTTEMGEIDPAALVEEAVDVLQSRARQKKIFITANFGVDIPSLVRGDATRIRQILLNLIGNAVKFTDRGGVQVNLSAGASAEAPCLLRFEVHDSGRGFDPALAARLFEPFTQDGGPATGQEGTGLGLSICRSLVELFGGAIGGDATPGGGASFWFTLPAAVVRKVPPTVRPDLTGVRVVFIGQGAIAANFLETYLTDRGALVTSESRRTALAFARDQSEGAEPNVNVAILLADGADGHAESEAAPLLREHHIVPLLFVPLLAGDCQITDDNQATRARLRLGFASVLTSEMSIDHLDRNIRLLVGHARTRGGAATKQSAVVADFGPAVAGARVLVLEDRLVNQMVIRKQLKAFGIDCTLATNGLKALEILDHRRFDLILCDCSMPEMNGYDFTREWRRREASGGAARRVPVVALTANAFGEDVEKCTQAGMDDFVGKPLTMDRLAAVLARWLPPAGSAEREHANGATNDGTPVLDLDALAKILGSDDLTVLNTVLEEFMAVAGVSLAQVQAAAAGGDTMDIKIAAHGAKGEARCVAATRLADVYSELDRTAKDLDRASTLRLVARASAEVRGVEEFIRERLGTRPSRALQQSSQSS